MTYLIRKAKPQEHQKLTQISFAAKRYWEYPEEYFDAWKDELMISEEYVRQNAVFAAEADGGLIAYYSVVEVKEEFFAGQTKVEKGFWLEHMFVLPETIGCGVGRRLYEHMKSFCINSGVEQIRIFADPNAKGFYETMGAVYIEERPSSIEGRTVSLLMERL